MPWTPAWASSARDMETLEAEVESFGGWETITSVKVDGNCKNCDAMIEDGVNRR